ncbi:hypothetical protein AB0469_31795 [Streptomyces sp. NPDC093801]|uniref:hypothetical protein n=1 Tax=Streptomyces sp. NPDC093801 TaxID=3155203 RepID=UPI00344ECB41
MNKVYERTENGVTTTVDRKAGLDEINAAMIGDAKKTVRTMSSISRTDYAIDYKDGRSVHLILVDAPAEKASAAEPEHCTPMAGGKIHTSHPGTLHDGSKGDPWPLCRTGASTNQGTRYRVVAAPLTCATCLEYARRREARLAGNRA